MGRWFVAPASCRRFVATNRGNQKSRKGARVAKNRGQLSTDAARSAAAKAEAIGALRRKSIVVRQDRCVAAPGEKLVIRLAAHRHLLPFLDDDLDFPYSNAPEAADQNIAQAQTFGPHRRPVSQGENVVRRGVQRLFIRKMEADECVGVAHFQPHDARPRLSVRVAGTTKML